MVAKLGRPPEVNDEVTYGEHVVFRVLDIDRLAVTRVRIDFPDMAEIKHDPPNSDHEH
ncbi:MAG: hypothetical protein IPG51_18145 [Chloroflexi bacterium]|nr:hypothetical protein [Chloroflexota bacterium]